MPVTTPGQKIDKTRLFGGDHVEIRLIGDFFDATLAAAQAFCAESGAHFLSPFDDDDVIEGQASVAVEMLDQMPEAPDLVILPVGGGGLSENRLCITIQEILNTEGIVLEPAGALSIDALRDLGPEIEGRRIVCVATGGNFDFERLPDVKERAMRFAGLKKYYVLRMPQRPGALRDFLDILGPDDDIARFEYLKKSARNFGSVLIGIESREPQAFAQLETRMAELGMAARDLTGDPLLSELVI